VDAERGSEGVVARHVMPILPPSVAYELTELGRELLPVDSGAPSATIPR